MLSLVPLANNPFCTLKYLLFLRKSPSNGISDSLLLLLYDEDYTFGLSNNNKLNFIEMKTKNSVKTVIFIICVTMVNVLNAQEKGTSMLNIGYGGASHNAIIETSVSTLFPAVTVGTASLDNQKSSGVFSADYSYFVKDNWSVGASLNYEQISNNTVVLNTTTGKQKNTYYTLGITTNYHYVNKGIFNLYSGVGLAYVYNEEKYNATSSETSDTKKSNSELGFQINALGLRVGKKFGGYVELGYGYKGIVNVGISYKF